MKGLIVLANGFEDIEAVGTIALLRRGGIELDISTIESSNPTGKYGVTIDEVISLSEVNPEEYGLIILPGGPGYMRLQESSLVREIVHDFHQKKKYIAAICAAPTILGHWGLLQNRDYTCFPGMQEGNFLGTYHDDKAVVDDFIITGKAAGAVTDFALKILSILRGEEIAEQVKQNVYY